MKNLRLLLALTGLCALTVTGCMLTSGQIFAHFNLPSPFTIDAASRFLKVPVDLNSIDEYEEHKDKFKGLSDLAVVGRFINVGGQAGAVEVWITADHTSNLLDVPAIQAGATRLWGPATLPAGAGAVRVIGWDESAALFTPAGKKMLIDEAKGDGTFALYILGTAGTYDIDVVGGALILTISAGI